MIDVLHGLQSTPPPQKRVVRSEPTRTSPFEDLFRQTKEADGNKDRAAATSESTLSFSKHARARLESRGIQLDDASLQRLHEGVERLAAKGASESLVLMDDHAFIVGVPKRTVITAMTRNEAMGNVFTKIDSTLFLP